MGIKGVNIDGRYLSHLHFADDIVLISINEKELRDTLIALKLASEAVDLKMSLEKTKNYESQ